MTNFKTMFGAALWMAVSGLMMVAALEPIGTVAPEATVLAAGSAPAATA